MVMRFILVFCMILTLPVFAVGENAFSKACRGAKFDVIKQLNQKRIRGANYPKLNTLCLVQLLEEQHGAKPGFADTMNFLLHMGANPNGVNEQGETVIELALNAPPIILERLFLAGARISKQDHRERGYFHLLLTHTEADLTDQLKVLINEGVSLNQRDRFGRTPLYVVAQYLELGLLKETQALKYASVLMDYGARQNISDWEGNLPFEVSKNKNWRKLLIEYNQNLY
jgi:ankyrin repeat protein